METKGIELSANSALKGQFNESRAQNAAHGGHADADLAAVVRAWPGLPADLREKIKRLVAEGE
jgi:hypothetical protein